MDLFTGEQFIAGDFPAVQNFAPQRHDRLKGAVSGLFGRAASGITFDQKEFTAAGLAAGAVGQLAWEGRALSDFFTRHFFGLLESALGIADHQFSDLFGNVGMLVQPETEGILDHAGNKGRRLT